MQSRLLWQNRILYKLQVSCESKHRQSTTRKLWKRDVFMRGESSEMQWFANSSNPKQDLSVWGPRTPSIWYNVYPLVKTIEAFYTTLMQFLQHRLKMYFLRLRLVKTLITPFCQRGRLCKLSLLSNFHNSGVTVTPSRNTVKRGAEISRKAAYNTKFY